MKNHSRLKNIRNTHSWAQDMIYKWIKQTSMLGPEYPLKICLICFSWSNSLEIFALKCTDGWYDKTLSRCPPKDWSLEQRDLQRDSITEYMQKVYLAWAKATCRFRMEYDTTRNYHLQGVNGHFTEEFMHGLFQPRLFPHRLGFHIEKCNAHCDHLFKWLFFYTS